MNKFELIQEHHNTIHNQIIDRLMVQTLLSGWDTLYTDKDKWEKLKIKEAREKFDGIKKTKPTIINLKPCTCND